VPYKQPAKDFFRHRFPEAAQARLGSFSVEQQDLLGEPRVTDLAGRVLAWKTTVPPPCPAASWSRRAMSLGP